MLKSQDYILLRVSNYGSFSGGMLEAERNQHLQFELKIPPIPDTVTVGKWEAGLNAIASRKEKSGQETSPFQPGLLLPHGQSGSYCLKVWSLEFMCPKSRGSGVSF